MAHPINNVVDGVLGTTAVTSPAWIDAAMRYLSPGATALMLIGGVIVVVLRVLVGINHYRHSKNQLKKDQDGE